MAFLSVNSGNGIEILPPHVVWIIPPFPRAVNRPRPHLSLRTDGGGVCFAGRKLQFAAAQPAEGESRGGYARSDQQGERARFRDGGAASDLDNVVAMQLCEPQITVRSCGDPERLAAGRGDRK